MDTYPIQHHPQARAEHCCAAVVTGHHTRVDGYNTHMRESALDNAVLSLQHVDISLYTTMYFIPKTTCI
jgi:hypothetical protein